jgi:HEAT repeat protein
LLYPFSGKYKSPPVIEALIDLLSDTDNNVKAVAAISLARTETNTARSREKLMDSLDDKDRLVRESGCLALGHLRVEEAAPKLVQLW